MTRTRMYRFGRYAAYGESSNGAPYHHPPVVRARPATLFFYFVGSLGTRCGESSSGSRHPRPASTASTTGTTAPATPCSSLTSRGGWARSRATPCAQCVVPKVGLA